MLRKGSSWVQPYILVLGACLIGVTAGCAHHPGGIAASTKPVSPGGYTVIKKVQGTDCVYQLLGLIPITGSNELKDAVADALSDAKGADALVEVTVDGYTEYWILWSMVCTQVNGTAVKTAGASSPAVQ